MVAGQHFIEYVDGKWQVYRVVNGRYRLNVGPKWPDLHEAMDYLDRIDDLPETTPLREPQPAA